MAIRSKIAEEIRSAKNCVLSTHVQPDGDALGSLLALGDAIRALGVPCTILSPGTVPANLRFLPLLDLPENTAPEPIDLFIVLDCADPKRIAPDPQLLDHAAKTVCIDHHRSNTGFCDINWIDPDSGSTVEMVYKLLETMALSLTREQAAWLYTGLLTDTGRFLYSGTTPASHRMAARLLEVGIDKEEIHRQLFQSMPLFDFQLYRNILARAEFHRKNQLAISWITRADYEETGASEETDAALNTLRDIEEVEMSALLKEQEPDVFKISLRSKRFVDVAVIAAELGGGGHLRAAGGTVHGSLTAVLEQLHTAIDRHWEPA